MSIKPFDNSKSFKTAAMLFAISGLIFIILTVSAIYFLPIGIALIIISISFWQRSRYLEKNEQKDLINTTKGQD